MAANKQPKQYSRPPSSIKTANDVIITEKQRQTTPDKLSPQSSTVAYNRNDIQTKSREEPKQIDSNRSPDEQLPSQYVADAEPIITGTEYTEQRNEMAAVDEQLQQQHEEQPVYGTEYDDGGGVADQQQYQPNYDGEYSQQQYDPNYTAEGYDAQYDQQYDQQPYDANQQQYEQYPTEYDQTYAGEQQQYETGTLDEQLYNTSGEQSQYAQPQQSNDRQQQQYQSATSGNIIGQTQQPTAAPTSYPEPNESNRNVGKEYTGTESIPSVTQQSEFLPKQSTPTESLQTKTN